VTNNNGFWIGWLDLLTPSCTISFNHNQWLPKTRTIFVLVLYLILFIPILPQLPALELDSLISTFLGPHGNHSLYCWQSLFTTPLPSNRSIFPRVCFCGNVLDDPLSSNGHGADHIQNNSCNTVSVVACAYCGRCLEMGLHVTVCMLLYN
jgi:hypothetical protein